MADVAEEDIAKLAASLKRGSIVAAAGCGKTEQIARATLIGDGRRLILTHTHAGIDVLRSRLKSNKVPEAKYRLDTIAGWCLRYAASFPKRSGLVDPEPRDGEWGSVYEAAANLVGSGAVNRILQASYAGLFVDEYQDCSGLQHQVVKTLSETLPVCVFGDPMQAIFDFNDQPVDWDADVFPTFPKAGELTTPWRWKQSDDLAKWLTAQRRTLEAGGDIDLSSRPACVKWIQLTTDPKFRNAKIVEVCKRTLGEINNETVVVIGDPANINARAAIAKNLSKANFSNIEPLGCAGLYTAAKRISKVQGFARLEAAMEFICDCISGAEQTDFLKAVVSRQSGGKLGTKNFGNLIDAGMAVVQSPAGEGLLDLMQGFYEKEDTYCFRKEMFFSMRAALRIAYSRQCDLADAIWEVQNRIRHAGRRIGKRSIGSTLLVKGLEFEHTVIVHSENMTRKDWYVALTRATNTVTILSPEMRLRPAPTNWPT